MDIADFFKKRYSLAFALLGMILVFVIAYIQASNSVHVMPWHNWRNILSYIEWSNVLSSSLGICLFAFLHSNFCEEF